MSALNVLRCASNCAKGVLANSSTYFCPNFSGSENVNLNLLDPLSALINAIPLNSKYAAIEISDVEYCDTTFLFSL